MRYSFLIITFNSLLLAIGITLVGISIGKYHNWWPLLTICVHLLAILFPTFCGSCQGHDDYSDIFADPENENPLFHVPWVLFGLMVIVGYAVPIELFRAHQLDQVAVYLTVAGGTTILTAVLIYVKIIYFQKSE